MIEKKGFRQEWKKPEEVDLRVVRTAMSLWNKINDPFLVREEI
jgi:hypothetical protein